MSLDNLIASQKLSNATGEFSENLANNKIFVRLSNKGIKLAEEITQAAPFEDGTASPLFDVVYDEDSGEPLGIPIVAVPASNRYVSAQDNQLLVSELRKKVDVLASGVRENRDNDFEDREGRLGELAALDLLLGQPQISAPLVEKILSETVKYLATKFAENAIGLAANAVLIAAAALFGYSL